MKDDRTDRTAPRGSAVGRATRMHQRRIGARLQLLRRHHGLTQDAAAAEAGISKRQLIRLEAGEANVSLSTLVTLACAYGVDVAEFFVPGSTIDLLRA